MTKAELKNKIYQAIDQVPESVLKDILEYLNQYQGSKSDKINLSQRLSLILREDKELLQRLAE